MTPAAPMPSQHVYALAALGNRRQYRKGTLIIQEGEQGDSIYIVIGGLLRTYLAGGNGKELTLAHYGPMDYVGEMSLDGGKRSANVEAVEPTTCSVISRELLLRYIGEPPSFALEMMERLIRRARLATESARNVALIDVYGRLAKLLTDRAEPENPAGERRVPERLTHMQLAQHLACSREMVSRLLKDLETGGYIAVRDRYIVLLKRLPARW